MLSFIKQLIAFRLGQTSARGAARLLGFGRLAMIAGVIGGIKAMRRHPQKHA